MDHLVAFWIEGEGIEVLVMDWIGLTKGFTTRDGMGTRVNYISVMDEGCSHMTAESTILLSPLPLCDSPTMYYSICNAVPSSY